MRRQRHDPAALYPGKDQVPIVQEAGWAPEPVCTGVENLAPLGFDPQTVQPVASRYTNWATWPMWYVLYSIKVLCLTAYFVCISTQSKSQLTYPCSACHDVPVNKCVFSCPSANGKQAFEYSPWWLSLKSILWPVFKCNIHIMANLMFMGPCIVIYFYGKTNYRCAR